MEEFLPAVTVTTPPVYAAFDRDSPSRERTDSMRRRTAVTTVTHCAAAAVAVFNSIQSTQRGECLLRVQGH
jgi:hypothetical protein